MFEKLREYEDKILELQHVINIISWDLRVSTPSEAKDNLIELIGSLENKLFSLETSEEYGMLLKNLIESEEFNSLKEEYKLNIKREYQSYLKNVLIPNDFYVKFVTFKEKSVSLWEDAKEKNDYKLFEPYLKEMVSLTKEYYSYLSKGNLYDTMLSSYEEGLTQDIIDPLFEELKIKLIPMIKELDREKIDVKMEYSTDKVMECAKYILEYMGFSMDKGALGIYPHGFTEKVSENDVRIAFKETNDVSDFVTTIIHEGGHGIFEQNMGEYSMHQFLGNDAIYALHESQSRFYENMLGRNKNFWIPIYDKVREILDINCDLDTFVDVLNVAVPSLVRTEADELTYCLHIILRYEIEKDLFSGKLSTEDLPRVWNEKMKEYLGVDVVNDSDGILQDMHWSDGSFGYFPAYLMGSIYDGMFLENIESKLGNIDTLLSKGEIKKITNYLIENIYKYGGTYTGLEVLNRLGIENVSVEPLVNYFEMKYGMDMNRTRRKV